MNSGHEIDVTEPQLLKPAFTYSLKSFRWKESEAELNRKLDPVIDTASFPCHTQELEKSVKLATESA